MENKYFRTTNFYQAAFLLTKGMTLMKIEKSAQSSRANFVFQDIPNREMLLETFNYRMEDDPDTLVDARKLIGSIRQLKEKLYQDNS